MHSIPNVAFGKVANRSSVRVFFPRMYQRAESKKIPTRDLESIYDQCLRPLILRLMPNQATHWPRDYTSAVETSRDRGGRLHFSSLDIPSHLLDEFSHLYLERIQTLRPYFRDAYFGHELRGWKAATVHNLEGDGEEDRQDGQHNPIYERVNALEDLTRVLDMQSINQEQWLVDVGLEFGIPGKVVTWQTRGHQALIRFLLPELDNVMEVLADKRHFFVDNQMHLKDVAGFRWTPHGRSDTIHYIQAYTTEKAVSYQLHQGIFSQRKPLELLTDRVCQKLKRDLEQQGDILYACTGDAERRGERSRPQEGCARLEVRVSLVHAQEVLTGFPRRLVNQTMVQIPAKDWWSVNCIPFIQNPKQSVIPSHHSFLQVFQVPSSCCDPRRGL